MTKNRKPPKPAGKIESTPDGGAWVKPLSAAKRPPAQSAKRALTSTTAAPAQAKGSAATKGAARSAAKRARPSPKPALEARKPASAEPARAAPKLVLVRAEAPVPSLSAGDPPALLDQSLSEARTLLSCGQASREAWSGSLAESASEASRGFAEINGKMLDLMRVQTDATLSLWRAMLGAHSMGEAVGLQASELRRQFEATATHMNDIVATTSRVAADALKPMQAFGERTRRAS